MKICIAGSSGLVGSAIYEILKSSNGHQVIPINRNILDLCDRPKVFEFINREKPDLIIDAAARVGGILSNKTYPADFLSQNLQIQTNLMDAAAAIKVHKFVFLGSTCIYPKLCPQPIKEEYLLTGPLEETNSAYAIAKIAGIEGVKAARKQFGLPWISLMPTNVYGPNDNFNLQNSHVLPALIRKFIEAEEMGKKSIEIWGDGSPMREFIHSYDLAEAIIFASENYDSEQHLNIGTGLEISIRDLAELIAGLVNFSGEIIWNSKMPNGTPRKVVNIEKITSLGWKPKIELKTGITDTITWYLEARKNGQLKL